MSKVVLVNFLIAIIALCTYQTFCEKFDKPVSVRCLTCLCHAASGCNLKQGCINGECGGYRISKDYWIQAARPTVNRMSSDDPNAFEVCASSAICGYYTIQRYMEKYQKDCNDDGQIDCEDFMRIHKLGPTNCTEEVPDTYQDRYEWCQDLVAE